MSSLADRAERARLPFGMRFDSDRTPTTRHRMRHRRKEGHSTMDETTTRRFAPEWHTVAEVAEMLGYGKTKVRMLVITGDLRSLKDGRSRRILPEWVDEYVARRVAESIERAA